MEVTKSSSIRLFHDIQLSRIVAAMRAAVIFKARLPFVDTAARPLVAQHSLISLFAKAGTKELWKRTAVDDLGGKSRSFQAKGAVVYISCNFAFLSLVENSP
jgi:hypothetical protein